jgi:hypothetical protein
LIRYQVKSLEPNFPIGFPTSGSDGGFILEQAVAYLVRRMEAAPRPFIGYFHFLPPPNLIGPLENFMRLFGVMVICPLKSPLTKY